MGVHHRLMAILHKQRFLTPGHQGWNDLHSLCRIGMEYYLLNNDDNDIIYWIMMIIIMTMMIMIMIIMMTMMIIGTTTIMIMIIIITTTLTMTIMKTRTTRTPAFWGYPPPPRDYPYYWPSRFESQVHIIDQFILDPKWKEGESRKN